MENWKKFDAYPNETCDKNNTLNIYEENLPKVNVMTYVASTTYLFNGVE
jgi:hypothetical protein